jgi:hypothetical protein
LRHIHMNHRPINFWSFQWKWNDKDDEDIFIYYLLNCFLRKFAWFFAK